MDLARPDDRPTTLTELAETLDADQCRAFTAAMLAVCGAKLDWGSDELGHLSDHISAITLPEPLTFASEFDDMTEAEADAWINYWAGLRQ